MKNALKFPCNANKYGFKLAYFDYNRESDNFNFIRARHIKTNTQVLLVETITYEILIWESIQLDHKHHNVANFYGNGKAIDRFYICIEAPYIVLSDIKEISIKLNCLFTERFLKNFIVSLIRAMNYIHTKEIFNIIQLQTNKEGENFNLNIMLSKNGDFVRVYKKFLKWFLDIHQKINTKL